jgi:hypothetical protein
MDPYQKLLVEGGRTHKFTGVGVSAFQVFLLWALDTTHLILCTIGMYQSVFDKAFLAITCSLNHLAI